MLSRNKRQETMHVFSSSDF